MANALSIIYKNGLSKRDGDNMPIIRPYSIVDMCVYFSSFNLHELGKLEEVPTSISSYWDGLCSCTRYSQLGLMVFHLNLIPNDMFYYVLVHMTKGVVHSIPLHALSLETIAYIDGPIQLVQIVLASYDPFKLEVKWSSLDKVVCGQSLQ